MNTNLSFKSLSETSPQAQLPAKTSTALRTIALTDIKVSASIGILPHERQTKQIIHIDVHVYMGAMPLLPQEDGVCAVLDYRKIYRIVQEEVERGHVNMLETLAGLLCQRLLSLTRVQGVRVRATKPEIFPNCSVTVDLQAGQTMCCHCA